MLKLLFHHRSVAIPIVEVLGVCALIGMFWRSTHAAAGIAVGIACGLAALCYGFLRICATIRWYDHAAPGCGIELHFKKVLSATVYILLIGGLFFQWFPHLSIPCVMAAILALIAHINIVLIYLHHRDTSTLPINHFSHGHDHPAACGTRHPEYAHSDLSASQVLEA